MTKRAPKTNSVAVSDGLMNVVTGSGTSADKTAYDRYGYVGLVTDNDAINAYRGSGLARKVHDLPPFEMTREWRSWQADADQIEKLEAEEKRLEIRDKYREALILARLTGGALIVMGLSGSSSQAVRGPSKLRYIHVFPKQSVGLGPIERDIESPNFGKPEHYEIQGVKIHPSRCIPVIANKAPAETFLGGSFWGDPLLMALGRAMKNCDATQNNIAALVPEAKTDIIGIPGLTTLLMNAEYESALTKRMAVTALFKSVHNVTLIDSAVQGGVGETWEQRQLSFGGLPEIQRTFNVLLAAVADIPYSRLFGESPGGLNSTGNNEQRDFERMVRSKQDVELRPILEVLDAHLINTALGSVPASVHWRFSPLSVLNEKEAAEVDSKNATTWKTLVDSAIVPSEVAYAVVKTQLIESGRNGGAEAAYEEYERGLSVDELVPEIGPTSVSDAAPRTLYVQRKLKNHKEFTDWAKSQGFKDLTPNEDLHVTIVYSRGAVDWMAMGEPWNNDKGGELVVNAGGARIVEPLGDKGAVVLLFNSSDLSWRHTDMIRLGATHDFPEYQPHVTITYSGSDVDLSKVEPYRGKLVFGPEIFEELNLDWSPSGGK